MYFTYVYVLYVSVPYKRRNGKFLGLYDFKKDFYKKLKQFCEVKGTC